MGQEQTEYDVEAKGEIGKVPSVSDDSLAEDAEDAKSVGKFSR